MSNTLHKRDYGIDLLKVISCCGIVAIHTINITYGYINLVLGLMAVICIPLFFMCNGYLMFIKNQEITYKYVFSKILRILLVCFSWELLHALAFWPLNGFRNFLVSFLKDFIQEGLFYHFWFFGSLIIIQLILPLLSKLQRKCIKGYVALFALLGAICLGLTVVSLIVKKPLINEVIQTFRIWVWLFYFMAGSLVAIYKDKLTSFVSKHMWKIRLLCLGLIIICLVYINFVGKYIYLRRDIQYFYQELPVILVVLCLFAVVVCNTRRNEFLNKASEYLSKSTMGIYIIHPFVFSVLKSLVPMFAGESALFNILLFVVTLLLCWVIVEVIRRIPVINKLVML